MDKQSNEYIKAIKTANDIYGTKSSIYRSSYIVKKYKEFGGKITKSPTKSPTKSLTKSPTKSHKTLDKSPKKSPKKPPKKSLEKTGLTRWFKEEWIQVVPYLQYSKIIECGGVHMNKSPGKACRPLYRITKDTPITIKELLDIHPKKDIIKVAKQKEKFPLKRLVWKSLNLV
jgi:hypothetical protein